MARTPTDGTILRGDGTAMEFEGASTTATIANGEALSGAIDIRGYGWVTVHMPAAWTAAELGLKAATTLAGTYGNVYKEAALYTVAVAADRVVVLDPQVTAGLAFIKLWSQNGAGVDANQGAARTLTVRVR
jgi:hypothetical protein